VTAAAGGRVLRGSLGPTGTGQVSIILAGPILAAGVLAEIAKLGIAESPESSRRVLAVLAYLQADRPDAFVTVLLHALGPADGQGPGALGPESGAPLLVDTSRERLPAAADVLRAEDPGPFLPPPAQAG